jgi:ACR3 family arsenite transporter
MVVGLLIGKLTNAGNTAWLPMAIPLGLFLMIYPAMVKLHLGEVKGALVNVRAAGIVLFFNYLINPLLLWLFGWIFLRGYPELWIGLILLGVAPCIAMVLVWTDLAGGNRTLAVTLMAWNSLIQMITTPLFIFLIMGNHIKLDKLAILQSVVLYLGLPLAAGVVTQKLVRWYKGEPWFKGIFTPALDKVQLGALLFTLIVMFSIEGGVIIAEPQIILLMAIPLTLFFLTLYFLTFKVSQWFRLPARDGVAVAFNSTGRNFELSIAIALSAFAATKMVGVATVVGPLIEVPLMLFLVGRAKKAISKSTKE